MHLNRKAIDVIVAICLLLVVALSFMPFSPLISPNPNRDAGIFINAGSEILRGKILYLQIWDNKQPLLYGVDAVGLWLGNGSIWGVWGLELGLFIAALLPVYRLLRKILLPLVSLGLIVAAYMTINPFMDGNYSEEYAIIVQSLLLGAFFLGYLSNTHRYSRLISAVLVGALSGLVFFIKPTYLDLSIAAVLFIVFLGWLEKDQKILLRIATVILGFVLIALPVFAYFLVHHALNEYILDAFLFHRYYAIQGPLEFIHSIKTTLSFIAANPFLLVMLGTWLLSLIYISVKGLPYLRVVLEKRISKWVILFPGICFFGLFALAQARGGSAGMGFLEWIAIVLGTTCLVISAVLFARQQSKAFIPFTTDLTLRDKLSRLNWKEAGYATFLFIGMIDLPIQVIGISLSGNNFRHYFILLFIPLLLMLTSLTHYLTSIATRAKPKRLLNAGIAAVLVLGLFSPVSQLIAKMQYHPAASPIMETAAYIKVRTMPQDSVLQWGWESVINFLAEREAPTRYSIQFPLYFAIPWRDQTRSTLLSDLQANPPRYIADTMDPTMPFIEGQTMEECLAANPAGGDGLQKILNFVCSNYEFEKSIGSINIYRYTK